MATVVVIALVLLILAAVMYTLFELSPFARHTNHYRKAQSGTRLWESPHLETRDEFEQRTRDTLN